MKALCKKSNPELGLTEGLEYEVKLSTYSDGFLYFGDCMQSVHIHTFEQPIDRLERLGKTAKKQIIIVPRKGETVDVYQTDDFLIMYGHTKGNHWNISGNHYRYAHDVNTGEFIPEHELAGRSIRPSGKLWKERLLKARAIALRNQVYNNS